MAEQGAGLIGGDIVRSRSDEEKLRFLTKLSERCDGHIHVGVKMWEIGRDVGLSDEETNEICLLLEEEGLIDHRNFGGWIELTEAGARRTRGETVEPDGFRVEVFVSCAEPEKEIAQRLVESLESEGLRCWFYASRDLSRAWGEPLIEEINRALVDSRCFLCLISRSYLERRWPMHELTTALSLEVQRKSPRVIPLVVYPEETKELQRTRDLSVLLSSKLFLEWHDSPDEIVQAIRSTLQENI